MKSATNIFKDLIISAQTNCIVKIKLRNQLNPLITAIDWISRNNIVLKPTSIYGDAIKNRTITLMEIEAVTRYKTVFNHPVFEKLRHIKKNLAGIRNAEMTNEFRPDYKGW